MPDARAVAIDIPIGLPETGRRAADDAARSLLGPRRSSVLHAGSYGVRSRHSRRSHRCLGSADGLRRQPAVLRARSQDAEVERWIGQAHCPVYEVHPEVSFAILLGAPASAPKKSWAGMSQRRLALERAGLSLDETGGEAAARAAVDDMLDAAVAAWSARRILRGQAVTLPDPPPARPHGRPIAIWA